MRATPDPRLDRLYRLVPQIYQVRDAAERYPLQALLRVIAEQVNAVEDDITQLYNNWFIETSDDWVVPYIADLIGYVPVLGPGEAGNAVDARARALNRVLVPRREVANTIRYRRRKGTLALLELLASDIAGWPARAVEFFRLLNWHQNINHPHVDRGRSLDLRRMEWVDLVGGPFDRTGHTVDIRRVDSSRTIGQHNIPSVGVFVWRLKAYSVTNGTTYFAEEAGPHCVTFSVLGQDAPLFINPQPQQDPDDIAGELNVPAPMRRHALLHHRDALYGPNKSLTIWATGWNGLDAETPIPAEAIVAADLTDWVYTPPANHVAVDPVLGRMAFPRGQVPKKGVRVTYFYGFSADIGGGEYRRPILDPSPAADGTPAKLYRVGKGQPIERLSDAIKTWHADKPRTAIIELADSAVYADPVNLTFGPDQALQIRAALKKRPVIRLLDWHVDGPDALSATLAPGSRLTFDGLLITGRAVAISGPERDGAYDPRTPLCGSEIVFRHCTLVPGWGIDRHCEPKRGSEASIELFNVRATLRVERSIIGSILVTENEVTADPIPVIITDSIVDATAHDEPALYGPGPSAAHAVATILRTTVIGIVDVHAIELGENSIFTGCVNVVRRQRGCLRFSYVPPRCRTPRRHRCQPDLVVQAVKDATPGVDPPAGVVAAEQLRVRPQFTSQRYGNPGYAQLAATCAEEIRQGADDGAEMGVFHDLFQPQRHANLDTRLDEYTPAGMDVGVIYVT